MRVFLALPAIGLCWAVFMGLATAAEPAAFEGIKKDVTQASGVNIHFTHAQPGELEMIRAAGFKTVRMDITWEATEKTRGVYDFQAYDHLMQSLEANGLKAVLILNYSNRLYENLRSVTTDEGRAAYARWAAAVVDHFRGKGIIWEIWNEPNIEGFWKPKPNADDYVKMARAACQSIKSVAPEEILVGPASSTIDFDFIEACFKGGLLDSWDAVSVHPYRQTGPENVTGEYQTLRELIDKYAPTGRKISILSGEWGYSGAWQNFDSELQGKMLTRQWVVNAANCIPLSIWYDWKDDGPDPREPEHRFGTVEREYQATRTPVYELKPAYAAAHTFNRELSGFQFSKRINLGNLDHHGYLFQSPTALCVVVWTTGGVPAEVKVPSSPGFFIYHYHTGMRASGGAVTQSGEGLALRLTDAPVFVKFARRENPVLEKAPEALPVALAVLPCAGGQAAVQVTSLERRPVKGRIVLTDVEGLKVAATSGDLNLAAGAVSTVVLFPLAEPPGASYRLGARLEIQGQTLLMVPARRFVPQLQVLRTGCGRLSPAMTRCPATLLW